MSRLDKSNVYQIYDQLITNLDAGDEPSPLLGPKVHVAYRGPGFG